MYYIHLCNNTILLVYQKSNYPRGQIMSTFCAPESLGQEQSNSDKPEDNVYEDITNN